MNWEVIFLDGKEDRPYRECKICKALKDEGLIEEVEPVAVFVPESQKDEIVKNLSNAASVNFGELLEQIYGRNGVENFKREIEGVFAINDVKYCGLSPDSNYQKFLSFRLILVKPVYFTV